MEPLTSERVELMIQAAIERYDKKQDERLRELKDGQATNRHDLRNFKDLMNNQFYVLKEQMTKQIDGGHAVLGDKLDAMKETSGKQFEAIRITLASTTGVRKYKEYLIPTFLSVMVVAIAWMTYVRGH